MCAGLFVAIKQSQIIDDVLAGEKHKFSKSSKLAIEEITLKMILFS